MSKQIAGDQINVSGPDKVLGFVITAIGVQAAKRTRLKVGERLCSSDIDELVEAGWFVKESR